MAKPLPPMWEEFGFREISRGVLTDETGKVRVLEAEMVWKLLRGNLARLRNRDTP